MVCFIFVIIASAVSVVVVDADIRQLISVLVLLLNCFVNLFSFVFSIHVHSTVSLHYACAIVGPWELLHLLLALLDKFLQRGQISKKACKRKTYRVEERQFFVHDLERGSHLFVVAVELLKYQLGFALR